MSKKSLLSKLNKIRTVPEINRNKSTPGVSPFFHLSNMNKTEINEITLKKTKMKFAKEIGVETNKMVPNNKTGKKSIVLLEDLNKSEIEFDSEELQKTDNKWMPVNWRIILNNIRIMRSEQSSPVDTMGCNQCSDEKFNEKERRFSVLLALMLSSRTKDEITYGAMTNLKQKISPFSPENMLKLEKLDLQNLIKPVAFYRNKSKFLTNTCQILIDKYDSDIPSSLEELITLPGVSSKVANICMSVAWKINTGIGVDTHVHRISNRLKWVKILTQTPEKTKEQLESWVPREIWGDLNILLVGFGQTICKAVKPKCNSCLNKNICPYSKTLENTLKNNEW